MRKITDESKVLGLLDKYIITIKINKVDFELKSYELPHPFDRYTYIRTTRNPDILERFGLIVDENLYNLQTKRPIRLDRYKEIEFYLEDQTIIKEIRDDEENLEVFFSNLL